MLLIEKVNTFITEKSIFYTMFFCCLRSDDDFRIKHYLILYIFIYIYIYIYIFLMYATNSTYIMVKKTLTKYREIC